MIDPSLHPHLSLVLTVADCVDSDQLEEGLGFGPDTLAEAVATLRSAMGVEEVEEVDDEELPLPDPDDVDGGIDPAGWTVDG